MLLTKFTFAYFVSIDTCCVLFLLPDYIYNFIIIIVNSIGLPVGDLLSSISNLPRTTGSTLEVIL